MFILLDDSCFLICRFIAVIKFGKFLVIS
jgi:hypothetical protein